MPINNDNYYHHPSMFYYINTIAIKQYLSIILSFLIYLPQYTINIDSMIDNQRQYKSFETCPVEQKQPKNKLRSKLDPNKFSKNRNNRYNQYVQNHQHTIDYPDALQSPSNKIIFSVNQNQINKVNNSNPGVGQYDISSPIVKPIYETFEKNNNVILVKLNHIGGTNSFCSQAERFVQQTNTRTPGPGAYYSLKTKAQSCSKQTYSENYSIIQQAYRNNRENRESIPSYKIGEQQRMNYNGMPRHLQEMYLQLSKPKDSIKMPALPLEKLVMMRKKAENKLIKVGRSSKIELNSLDTDKNLIKTRKHWADRQDDSKLTQTIYRLQRQSKRQQQIAKKIKAILKGDKQKRKSASVGRQLNPSHKLQNRVADQYNQSMVNMIFHKKTAQKKSQQQIA